MTNNLIYEENASLLKAFREGDKSALDLLIEKNMGLVKNIAARFRDRGTEYEDLVQIGIIGMIKAVRSYDESFGTVFSTYAVPLIIGEIRRFLRDDGQIKLGRTLKRQSIDIIKRREIFIRENGHEPRLSELAELCGITTEEAAVALEASSPVRSLSEPAGDDETITLGSQIAEKSSKVEEITERIALAEAVRALTPLHRKIVSLRWFRGLSQQQTGDMLGLTQVKISREEKKIKEILRNQLNIES